MPRSVSSLDIHSSSDDRQTFPGKRALISFLSWLDYCDQLIIMANEEVAKHFANEIEKTFLNSCMKVDILQVYVSSLIEF